MRSIGRGLVIGGLIGKAIDWLRRADFVASLVTRWWGDSPAPTCDVMIGAFAIWVPWALMAAGVGLLIWDHRSRGIPLTASSWVEKHLVKRGFDANVVQQRLTGCVARLRYGGIETQEAAERFFADEETLQDLKFDVYPHDLRRTESQLDSIGYCMWGPGLHRCPDAKTRAKHLANLKEIIRDMGDHGER